LLLHHSAPEGHMQITIMIDTQQQYIKLNIRGEISIIVMNNFFYDYSDINQKGPSYNKDTHKLKAQKVTG
jgi:hypothetical protein